MLERSLSFLQKFLTHTYFYVLQWSISHLFPDCNGLFWGILAQTRYLNRKSVFFTAFLPIFFQKNA